MPAEKGAYRDAALVEQAAERGDLAELRRLADAGNADATAVLADLLEDGEEED